MILRCITSPSPATGGVKRAWRDRDHCFELAPVGNDGGQPDPAHGLRIDNYAEALEWVEKGYAIRMSNGRVGSIKWVKPASLRIEDVPGSALDTLWTPTLPEPPLSRATLAEDVARFLKWQADMVALLASPRAALSLFESQRAPESFHLAELAVAAHEAAFRTGRDRPLDAGRVATCEQVLRLVLAMPAGPEGQVGRHRLPALWQTLYAACARYRLSHGDTSLLDFGGTVTENLALLAGISPQAGRNALAAQGISAARGRLEAGLLLEWLQARPAFAPLRECERPQAKATLEAVAMWQRLYPGGNMPLTLQELREYARAKDLAIDLFLVGIGACERPQWRPGATPQAAPKNPATAPGFAGKYQWTYEASNEPCR